MTQNYNEAVEMADVLFDMGALPEQLVAIGYRAGLQDAAKALKEGGAASGYSEGATRLYAVVKDKLAAVARKFETRAKELKV